MTGLARALLDGCHQIYLISVDTKWMHVLLFAAGVQP